MITRRQGQGFSPVLHVKPGRHLLSLNAPPIARAIDQCLFDNIGIRYSRIESLHVIES